MGLIALADMQAHSPLAEVQALDAQGLARLEGEALGILEAELERQCEVDTVASERRVPASGLRILRLPEAVAELVSVVVALTSVNVTEDVRLTGDGWFLQAHEEEDAFTQDVLVTAKWGMASPPARLLAVLMDVIEALAVRHADTITRRDEVSPWGSVVDGGMSASRDTADRRLTLENLLRFDARRRLRGCYRPGFTGVV